MEDVSTEGVEVLRGDHRKAIVTLAVPLGVAILMQQLNNVVDSFWVSSLGAAPLAAVGVVYPIYAIMIGLGNGLGIGSSSAISRDIGRRDRESAERTAMQSLVLVLAVSVPVGVVLALSAEPLFVAIGGGDIIGECLDYGLPLFVCAPVILLSGMLSGMLRGEGAAKRSMYMQVCGAGLNMVLDPLMINVLGMGVSGAAWATSISFAVSCAVALLWYVRRKGMYVRLNRGYVRPEKRIVRDILSVGLPESMELCVMSVFNVFLNIFVLACGGEGSLAIFSASWRIFYILMVPAQCLGGALVNVASTEMGMGRPDIVRDAFRYAAVVAFVALVAGSVALAVLNGPVAAAFTGSPDLLPFRDEFSGLILCFCLFLPVMSFIYTGSSLMQGIDRATGAMVNTLARNILLLASFALVTATTASTWDLWIATTVVEIFGGFMMLAHATVSLSRVVGKPMR